MIILLRLESIVSKPLVKKASQLDTPPPPLKNQRILFFTIFEKYVSKRQISYIAGEEGIFFEKYIPLRKIPLKCAEWPILSNVQVSRLVS